MGLLATAGRVVVIGPIRQELLSGVSNRANFDLLDDYLREFPDADIDSDDYRQAAIFFNDCRRRGIQGSATDFLICAVAHRLTCSIYTSDKDFDRYGRFIPVLLHRAGDE